MKLFLIRHGEAEGRSLTGKDFDRKLSDRGIQEVNQLCNYLESKVTNQENVAFISSARRTRETSQILLRKMKNVETQYDDELYLATLHQLLDFCWKHLTTTENIFLIGHNFGISELASYFLDEEILLPTSAMLTIDFPFLYSLNEVSKGMGIKESFFIPY